MTESVARRERGPSEGEGLAAQWVGLLLAPAAFFAHLQLAYAMVPWACAHHAGVWIHVAGAVAVALAAAGGVVAWRVMERTGRAAPGEKGGALSRARLLAQVGLPMSAVFVLLLLAQWVTTFVISPCQ